MHFNCTSSDRLHEPSHDTPSVLLLLAQQLVHKSLCIVNLTERLDDRPRMDGDGACLLIGVVEINNKRIDVAIKDSAHELTFAIDNRTAGVAASDVGRADKVKWCVQVEPAFPLQPSLRQIEGWLVFLLGSTLVEAGKDRLKRNPLTTLPITLNSAES